MTLTRRTPLRRSPFKRRGRGLRSRGLTPIPLAVRRAVQKRDGWSCAACHRWLGTEGDVHHRIKRSLGGANDLDNLVLLDRGCHTRVHAAPALARTLGLLLASGDNPADIPVRPWSAAA